MASWHTIKKALLVGAAVVTIFGGISSAAIFVADYADDVKDLAYQGCVGNARGEIVAIYLRAENAYAKYINEKTNILDLQRQIQAKDAPELQNRLYASNQNKDRYWQDTSKFHKQAREKSALLEGGELCPGYPSS